MENNDRYFYTEDMNAIYDIYELFQFYNNFFFQGVLEKSTIQWSKKMTLCAGTCQHKAVGSCSIKLSQPLLKYRTCNQLKQTILHQMIHGYLFLTNPQACLTEGGHGKQFKQIMNNINKITGLRITVYHSFHDQVQVYKTHVWRCDGPCKQKPPYYGYVKRSMNRKPQPADSWWKQHQRYCGGQFTKISQPQNNSKKVQLKNGKTLKTNIKLQKSQQDNAFKGQGKTLQDYIKQMQKKEKKNPIKSKQNQKNIQSENNYFSALDNFQKQIQMDYGNENYQSQSNFSNSIFNKRNDISRQKSSDNNKNNKKKESKSKSKQPKQERNSYKITDWFQKKGKTIEQYSKQIQEQKNNSKKNQYYY